MLNRDSIVSIPHGKCPVCRLPTNTVNELTFEYVSIPHGKCPVCRPALSGCYNPAQRWFQFPTGSVLSADNQGRPVWAGRADEFQFPTGSVLSADLRFCFRCASRSFGFNSPREVSCLPTGGRDCGRRGHLRVSIPHGKCPVCRQEGINPPPREELLVSIPHGKCPVCRRNGRPKYLIGPLGRFNSPREVSCLPTTGNAWASISGFLTFQFPTGSVLSADTGYECRKSAADRTVSIPHGKCPVCRRRGIHAQEGSNTSSFNSPREVSCLPTSALSWPWAIS